MLHNSDNYPLHTWELEGDSNDDCKPEGGKTGELHDGYAFK